MFRPNLLRASSRFRRNRRWRFASGVLLALGLTVAALILIATPFAIAAVRMTASAASGQSKLAAAQAALERLDLKAVADEIAGAGSDFRDAKVELEKLRLIGWLPPLARRLEAADALLGGGIAATDAARGLIGAAASVLGTAAEIGSLSQAISGQLPDLGTVAADLTPERKREILAAVAASVPDLREAADDLDKAQANLDHLAAMPEAAGLLASLEPARRKIRMVRASLDEALPLAEILPGVLGYPEAKNYLFIFQNHTELRPTGGFLSMVGLLTVKDAEPRKMEIEDVYAYDGPSEKAGRPTPPAPIRKYLGLDRWYLRDANWSPDFVAAAETIAAFWREEYAVRFGQPAPDIHGIIAITPKLAEDMLRVIGPLTVDGRTFDADNLVDDLEFQVEKAYIAQGIAPAERKDIVGDLFNAAVAKASALPLTQWLALIAAADNALAQGHVLLAAADPVVQSLVLERDWGGKMKIVRGDYLSVIDANLASLKSDAVVDRSVAYSIAPDGQNGFLGKVAVTYRNNGTFTWKTTRYRTYVRVYVPAGSELVGVSGALENDKLKDPGQRPGKADVGDEAGRRWFGAFTSTEPGQTRTIEFTFKLAPSVVQSITAGTYRLDVEKQPGTLKPGLTLDLDFGKAIASAVPAEKPQEFGDSRYHLSYDLLLDRTFEIGLK